MICGSIQAEHDKFCEIFPRTTYDFQKFEDFTLFRKTKVVLTACLEGRKSRPIITSKPTVLGNYISHSDINESIAYAKDYLGVICRSSSSLDR